jgi:dihydroorotate dehydrogenase (fumarate)/dihydroorotate dehydrogenase
VLRWIGYYKGPFEQGLLAVRELRNPEAAKRTIRKVDIYKRAVRPALFSFDAELAHRLARPVLRSRTAGRLLGRGGFCDPRLEVAIGEFRLPGPIGLAPGFDKYGELTRGTSRLGFDYLVPGTIMAEPASDPPGRKLVRLVDEQALVNCQGLPSKGLEHSARELERGGSAVPLVISIGALDVEGFLRCHGRLEPLAAAIELNVQCHNEEPGAFEDPAAVEELVSAIVARKRKPLFFRINAYRSQQEREKRMDLAARTYALGVDGFSAVGTSIIREDARLVAGRGVLTGAPLRELTLQAIRDLWEVTGGRGVIRARGGISTGEDVFAAIAAGAATVEVFTSFVYQGWSVASRLKRELLAAMERESVPSVASLRGLRATASTSRPPATTAPRARS